VDLSIISINSALRKDPIARADALNSADVVILCLPDAAAREAVFKPLVPLARESLFSRRKRG
jgi:3-hydroxyisobutyrate dehydrogenase-like beta-hydroxyacid dehydrogenase